MRAKARQRQNAAEPASLAIAAGALLVVLALMLIGAPRHRPAAAQLTMAQARAANAAVPIDSEPLRPARRYVFHGGPAAREQAIECLATVARYEAGDDVRGQRAVMQVVLNRTRSRGFPATICGVVYQGSGLTTGCQFSFACDGSVMRRPERTGWLAARRRAADALSGAVFAPVGTATHYHADWMVPYWRDSLDKVAVVGSHVFYRRYDHEQ